jgi:hypothetical protein
MNKILLTALTALTIIATLSSCHRTDDTNACPGTVVSTWKVDGVAFESYIYLYTHTSTVSNFTMVACTSGSNNETVQLAFVPYPPAPGMYDLKWNGQGMWNHTGSGQYLTDEDGNYLTDSTTYTGSFDIASVNTTDKTITGQFHFTAHENNGTRTVHVTDGVFTNMKYE